VPALLASGTRSSPIVNEVYFVESAVDLGFECFGRRRQQGNAGLLYRQNFLAPEVAVLNDFSQRLSRLRCEPSLPFPQLILVVADVDYLVFDD